MCGPTCRPTPPRPPQNNRCVAAYPNETREVLDSLYALWFDHLWDNIPTVREDSAVALGQAVRAYGQEALDKITAVLK